MKYIRTKDGRMLQDTDCENFSIEDYSNYMNGVYNQADTIEELCDEFVAVDIGVIKDRKKNYKNLEEAKTDKNFLYDRLYGAIWTDKGLIYVAKMNDKGELELL